MDFGMVVRRSRRNIFSEQCFAARWQDARRRTLNMLSYKDLCPILGGRYPGIHHDVEGNPVSAVMPPF